MRWYDRLRRSGEIAYVRRRGRAASLATVSVYAAEAAAAAGRVRVCVSVSKSVGNAVTRNLVRRRIRGALDALPPQSAPGRLLFVAKPAAVASYDRLAADVAAAVRRLTPGA